MKEKPSFAKKKGEHRAEGPILPIVLQAPQFRPTPHFQGKNAPYFT